MTTHVVNCIHSGFIQISWLHTHFIIQKLAIVFISQQLATVTNILQTQSHKQWQRTEIFFVDERGEINQKYVDLEKKVLEEV